MEGHLGLPQMQEPSRRHNLCLGPMYLAIPDLLVLLPLVAAAACRIHCKILKFSFASGRRNETYYTH